MLEYEQRAPYRPLDGIMFRARILTCVIAATLSLTVDALSDLSVSVLVTPPDNAQALSPTLISFSIEQDRWPEWAGEHSRNDFTYNALQNHAATFPPPTALTSYPEASSIVVGDGFYTLPRFLPSGTRMVKASGVILARFEIGNEPDIYNFTGLRTGDWPPELYIEQWTASAEAVAKVAGIQGNQGRVTLQGAAFGTQQFTPREVFALGLLDSEPGRAISVISQHHYSVISSCNGTQISLASFMSKESVRSNLTIFEADIAAVKAKGLGYVLGETNNAACHGAPGAATLGIQEAYFHEGIGYTYNFFQPAPLNRSITDGTPTDPPQPPHVQPLYYAGLVVGSFIGTSGVAKIVELDVNDPNVSGYAAFEKGRLARVVFINLHAWLSSNTGTRPSVHVDFDFAKKGMSNKTTASVKRLKIQHTDDLGGLTWAGQSFETSDARPAGMVVEERLTTGARLQLRASEAVVVSFQ
ncbi:hypothetical protein BV20DRAFT_1052316 [Pilatotrama ljubarskyi]|nr:hypothetical protein BV20DRAFT_1052316 [Pilatotrama ljubarskyi]